MAAFYEEEGKKFIVIRHFSGKTEIGRIVAETARARADKDAGFDGCRR